MSVDYKIVIHRKKDDKVIAEFWANQLKTIFDSNYSDVIHCEKHGNNDKKRFTVSDLNIINKQVTDNIDHLYSEIFQKKMMITMAKSQEIKNELEDDIYQLTEKILELNSIKTNVNFLIGSICCLTEYQIIGDVEAYMYNAKDLNEKVETTNDSVEYVFSDNVECEIISYF